MERAKVIQALATPQSPKFYLNLFWEAVEGASQIKKLELLRALGGIKPARNWENPRRRREVMRKHFTFALVDFEPETPCFLCGGPWAHRHHILNIQNGGGNSRRNVVPLCKPCHSAVHQRRL